jgi:tetratricopeptide (TPR) repeat protein
MTRTNGLTPKLLLLGGALLVANSAYLASDGDPHFFYFTNLFVHLGLGIAVAALFLPWWWRRRKQALPFVSGLLLVASALVAVVLLAVGNERPTYFLVWIHVGLAIAGLVGLVIHALRHSSGSRLPRLAALGLALAIALPIAALWWQERNPDPRYQVVNPPAPTEMQAEAMQGADGPFFPSSVSNAHGGVVPSSIYMDPQSCGRSGCHPDLLDQWQSSVHHRGSFNNQWYRKSIEYMQEVAGVEASKWCGGCHDPAILQSGMMDTPITEIVNTPQAQAGITCTACHMISSVGSSMGNGDYEITIPALHDLATSDNALLTGLHDFVVRMDPEPHRRTFIKPFFRGEFSPEYCSSCHKVHLDEPVNSYRWIRGFNEYDNWQASGVSGFGARSFYYPPEPQNCIDCHMPLVPSDDAAAKDGMIRSHRFAAANTAVPTAYHDEEQLQAVTDFLQARQVTVDIFAMTEGQEIADGESEGLATEGPALATTFAVGEESGMAVGMGAGLPSGPAEPVYAPLDRIPATVRRGESNRIDVVVRTRGVGHFFPGGTVDAYDCWVELQAVDSNGEVLYWSGMADEDAPVDDSAHFYKALLIDEAGNEITKRNAWAARATVYVRLIPPGAADTVRFRLDVPEDAGDEIELTARLNYRKFSWENTHFSYAGEAVPGSGEVTPHFDNREFTFTADMSNVSGPTKQVPRLPIVVMAEDTQTLGVIDADAELPDMGSPALGETDRERWNDYGIGLLLQGDLRGARAAFTRVTEVEPGYVDGWVNLGRVAVAEGALDEAREVLGKALEMEPRLARGHFFLGLVDKESGDYEAALEHLRTAAEQYPKDRVVRNQTARVLFLQREYDAAIEEIQHVLAIDPEDLMAHYTLMLAHRGAGDLEKSKHHQTLYERFKADESSQELTREYREEHPHDNNERQPIHEHGSPSREEIEAFLARPERAEDPDPHGQPGFPDGGRAGREAVVTAGGGG